jgi:hypothetical protein
MGQDDLLSHSRKGLFDLNEKQSLRWQRAYSRRAPRSRRELADARQALPADVSTGRASGAGHHERRKWISEFRAPLSSAKFPQKARGDF